MRKGGYRPRLPFLTLCVVFSLSAQAEVYKWTDAEGRVHFGDRPPPSGAESVPLPSADPAAAPASPGQRLETQRRLLRAFEDERRQKRDAAAKAREEKAIRQRNCLEARDDLRSEETAGSVYRLDAEGRRVYLDAAERERSLAEARERVKAWCGSG